MEPTCFSLQSRQAVGGFVTQQLWAVWVTLKQGYLGYVPFWLKRKGSSVKAHRNKIIPTLTWPQQGCRLPVSDGEHEVDDADLSTDDGEREVVDRARLDSGSDGHDVRVFADDVQLVEVRPGFVNPRLRPTRPIQIKLESGNCATFWVTY